VNNFKFSIEIPELITFTFTVMATSPEEAVERVNSACEYNRESDECAYTSPFQRVKFILHPNFKVDANMIVEVSPAKHLIPAEFVDYLQSQGYEYLGSDDLDLWYDADPRFMKYLKTESGEPIGWLHIEARYDNAKCKDWTFHIESLYFREPLEFFSDDKSDFHYEVGFHDTQPFTNYAELPDLLNVYESKFLKLAQVLRQADPGSDPFRSPNYISVVKGIDDNAP
jgi:hypothetical protein